MFHRGLISNLLLTLFVSILLTGCGKPQPPVSVKVLPKTEMVFTLQHQLTTIDDVCAKQAELYKKLSSNLVFRTGIFRIIGQEDTFTISTDAVEPATAKKQLTAATTAMTQVFGQGRFTAPAASAAFHPVDAELLQQVSTVLKQRMNGFGIRCTIATKGSDIVVVTPKRAINEIQHRMLVMHGCLELWLIPNSYSVTPDEKTGEVVGLTTDGKKLSEKSMLQQSYMLLMNNDPSFKCKPVTDHAHKPAISFTINQNKRNSLNALIASHQNFQLAIVSEGKVFQTLNQVRFSSDGTLEDDFDMDEVKWLCTSFNNKPLPTLVDLIPQH